MGRYVTAIVVVAALVIAGVGSYLTLSRAGPASGGLPIETMGWEQLVPGEIAQVFDNWEYVDSLSDEQLEALWVQYETATNTVLAGKRVQIAGFMVSLDLDTSRRVEEFIFVPYQGACIHTPAPPPNQTILVEAPGGTKVWDNWEPVQVTGVLSIEQSEHDIAVSGYTITMDSIEAYDAEGFAVAAGAHGGAI